ncbi:MAG TPA: GIY-YIG nuclease family protein [Aestuariivirga sp.]|nr:GIY-YIG nuclease family protein [Aestuariivirga sp.]
MGAWVYILRCKDGSYYTGLTRSQEPEKRLSEHNISLSPRFLHRETVAGRYGLRGIFRHDRRCDCGRA